MRARPPCSPKRLIRGYCNCEPTTPERNGRRRESGREGSAADVAARDLADVEAVQWIILGVEARGELEPMEEVLLLHLGDEEFAAL